MNDLILVLGGVVVGLLSVVLGGGLFWSMPLWQFLFPELAFGALIGNLKVGGLLRGFASTLTTWKQIDLKRALTLSAPLLFGSVFGAISIARLDQLWSVAALVIAVLVVEFSSWLAKRASSAHFILGSLLLGVYFGFFGAGGGVLIVALLRLRTPADEEIAHVKAEARFIEFLMAFVAVAAHFASGNIISSLWIPWAAGSVIGGFLGGLLLNKLGTMSATGQKAVLRFSYLLAIAVSLWSSGFIGPDL